ncbi:MAG: T9SS type A sorting domain-containing protein [Ignavibacteria bacterium]|nr:T9SS type A sorting domain-containing protein [Ignavibacteria bacterium]
MGWFETIIKTTDGGDSWIVIRNNGWGFGASYNALFFIDENTGWIAGGSQRVLRTTNGGDSIITDYLFAGNLQDMYFKDALTGIVSGSGTDMFKTTNGGLSWNNIVMPIGFRIPEFYKLTFVNDLTGWVAGTDRRIFKTTDFGDTWFYIDSIAVNPQMRCAEFIDENTGFVGGEQGYLFKSTDGGENFVRENSGLFPPAFMASIHFYNDSIGWAVGGGGKIIKTTNGGQTLVNIISQEQELPNEFSLSQNFPNPFNSKTKINYKIGKEAFIQIKITDLSGKEIKTLINKKQNMGNYEINFDATELSSGIYFYSLYIDKIIMDNKKFVLLK